MNYSKLMLVWVFQLVPRNRFRCYGTHRTVNFLVSYQVTGVIVKHIKEKRTHIWTWFLGKYRSVVTSKHCQAVKSGADLKAHYEKHNKMLSNHHLGATNYSQKAAARTVGKINS